MQEELRHEAAQTQTKNSGCAMQTVIDTKIAMADLSVSAKVRSKTRKEVHQSRSASTGGQTAGLWSKSEAFQQMSNPRRDTQILEETGTLRVRNPDTVLLK